MDPVRRITSALFISGALNITLLAGIFYWLVKEEPPRPYCDLKPAEQMEEQVPFAKDAGNAEVLRNNRSETIEQLVAKLNETQLVENGFTQRDLALGALVSFYHFDLSRALLGQAQPTQQRTIPYGQSRDGTLLEVTVYPGLIEPQFQAIMQYAKTERWPFTSQGLYQLLRKQPNQQDPSLVDAFFLTPEFLTVEMLFNRSEKTVEKKDLLSMLLQGDWKVLSTFAEQQRTVQDLSPARRQKFLMDYIDRESRAAAYLMLKTDGAFAFKKLDDEHVLAMLNLLVEKTPETEQFSTAILSSPRSDAVLKLAATRLYEFAGEPLPAKDLQAAALVRFSGVVPAVPAAVPAAVVSLAKAPAVPVATTKPISNPPEVSATAAKPASSKPALTVKKAVSAPKKEKAKLPITASPKKPKSLSVNQIAVKSTGKKDSKVVAALEKRPRMYVVSDGDSLWKIARKFNVDIETLRKCNRLKNDRLKPGSALLIP